MKIILKYCTIYFSFLLLIGCSKDDESSIATSDYQAQYLTDISNIESFMKTHYLTVINHPGYDDDTDVTYTKIPSGGRQISIWGRQLIR